MNRPEFEKLIAEEFPKAVPEKFRALVKNVAFLVEDKPSREVRREEGLLADETLLGLYRGVPHSVRGDHYGVGPTLPDVVILYRLPIHDEAQALMGEGQVQTFYEGLRKVVHETIWHEVAHYLGIGEDEVRAREEVRRAGVPASDTAAPSDQPRSAQAPPLDSVLNLLPKNMASQSVAERPTHPPIDPIEVEHENSEVFRKLHEPLIPESENAASIDPEGGGDGIKNWWEGREPEKPEGMRPEERIPGKSGPPEHIPKTGEPPTNLPTG